MNCFHRAAMQVAVEKSQAYPNLTLSWFAPDDSHPNPGFVVWWEELLLMSYTEWWDSEQTIFISQSQLRLGPRKKAEAENAGWVKPAEMFADMLWCFVVLEVNSFFLLVVFLGHKSFASCKFPCCLSSLPTLAISMMDKWSWRLSHWLQKTLILLVL